MIGQAFEQSNCSLSLHQLQILVQKIAVVVEKQSKRLSAHEDFPMNHAQLRARVSMPVNATALEVFHAFVEPEWLTRYWLSKASKRLQLGDNVEWEFLVSGAKDTVSAISLDPGKIIEWRWSTGKVRIDLEPFEAGTTVTATLDEFPGSLDEKIGAALNATEGFSIVICNLKILLETGRSGQLAESKARLISART